MEGIIQARPVEIIITTDLPHNLGGFYTWNPGQTALIIVAQRFERFQEIVIGQLFTQAHLCHDFTRPVKAYRPTSKVDALIWGEAEAQTFLKRADVLDMFWDSLDRTGLGRAEINKRFKQHMKQHGYSEQRAKRRAM